MGRTLIKTFQHDLLSSRTVKKIEEQDCIKLTWKYWSNPLNHTIYLEHTNLILKFILNSHSVWEY